VNDVDGGEWKGGGKGRGWRLAKREKPVSNRKGSLGQASGSGVVTAPVAASWSNRAWRCVHRVVLEDEQSGCWREMDWVTSCAGRDICRIPARWMRMDIVRESGKQHRESRRACVENVAHVDEMCEGEAHGSGVAGRRDCHALSEGCCFWLTRD